MKRIEGKVLTKLLAENDPGRAIAEYLCEYSARVDEECLNKLSRNGGWVFEAEYSPDGEFDSGEGFIEVTLQAWFVEEFPGSCADAPNHQSQRATVYARVDTVSGSISYEAESAM